MLLALLQRSDSETLVWTMDQEPSPIHKFPIKRRDLFKYLELVFWRPWTSKRKRILAEKQEICQFEKKFLEGLMGTGRKW